MQLVFITLFYDEETDARPIVPELEELAHFPGGPVPRVGEEVTLPNDDGPWYVIGIDYNYQTGVVHVHLARETEPQYTAQLAWHESALPAPRKLPGAFQFDLLPAAGNILVICDADLKEHGEIFEVRVVEVAHTVDWSRATLGAWVAPMNVRILVVPNEDT